MREVSSVLPTGRGKRWRHVSLAERVGKRRSSTAVEGGGWHSSLARKGVAAQLNCGGGELWASVGERVRDVKRTGKTMPWRGLARY